MKSNLSSAATIAIRPYLVDDAEAMAAAARESVVEVQPWMTWCHAAYSVDEARAWLQVQVSAFGARTAFEFAIVSPAGHYLGACGLNRIDHLNRRANLGYWVRSSAARQGVATVAVRSLRDWAMENTDLVRLEIVVALGNAASLRVAERAGAAREGTLRKRILIHGVHQDAAVFSLTRGD